MIPACPESRPEWMELGGGGGAVCYAPSRLGKLVLRITGFPRVTQQCHQSQQQEDSHHRETRHLYLGFHHPWDRDLWKSWIKQVSRTRTVRFQLDRKVFHLPILLLFFFSFKSKSFCSTVSEKFRRISNALSTYAIIKLKRFVAFCSSSVGKIFDRLLTPGEQFNPLEI